MKQILRLMAMTIAAVAFVACSDSDNPVSPDVLTGNAVVTVNVKALYEQLDAVDSVIQKMEEYEEAFIVGTVLIYDANGDLIQQLTDSVRQLDPITFDVKDIPSGTYTLVACEYLDWEGYPLWKFTDVEKLSTVRVEIDTYYPVLINALGVVSETVTVDGSLIETNVTPEAAGSCLKVHFDGIREKDDFSSFVVYECPKVEGIYLNPALSDFERAYAPDNSLFWSVFQADDLQPGSNIERTFILSSGGHTQLSVDMFNSEDIPSYITTYDMYMQKGGKVNLIYYDFNDWNMHWQYCGLEDNFADWKKEKDEAPMIFKPCTNWGCSLEEARAHVKATHGWFMNRTNGELEEYEGAWEEEFQTGINHKEYYGFETQDGQNLLYVCYVIKAINLPVELITNSLASQGYVLTETQQYETEDYYGYLSADKSVFVSLYMSYDDKHWTIWFEPNNSTDEQPAPQRSKQLSKQSRSR